MQFGDPTIGTRSKTVLPARPRPPTGSDRKRGACDQALGRSRGGLTTKIHMLAEEFGRPLRFLLTPSQVHNIVPALVMLEGRKAKAVIADTAYDRYTLRDVVCAMGA